VGRIASVSRPKSLSRDAARVTQHAASGDADPFEAWQDFQDSRLPDEPAPHESEEYWNPEHLYHGTSVRLRPGDLAERGHPSNFSKALDHAYATPHVNTAASYAETAAANRGGRPRVYEVERAADMMPDPETGAAFGYDSQVLHHPDWRSKAGFRVIRELHPHEISEYQAAGHTAAAHWAPSSGIFAPTTGLDLRLFDGHGHLRPSVRGAIMERLDQCLRTDTGLTGSDWQGWLKVYLAGGSASEWAGSRPHEAAQDLDVLIGVDYAGARSNTPEFRTMTDTQIDAALNAGLRGCFNTDGWSPDFEGTWDLTGYVNPQAWDIRSLKPYAAWDLSDSRWAVRPPHLPDHALADFNPAVLAEARAIATEARAILRLPEPLRTREARALWDRIHTDRRAAFSDLGEGWTDPGNVIEKWLAYAPGDLLGRVRELALSKTAAADDDWQWSRGDRDVPEMVPLDDLHGVASANHPGLTLDDVWQQHHPDAASEEDESIRGYIGQHGTIPGTLVTCSHGSTLEDGEHRYMAARDAGLPAVPVMRTRSCLTPDLHRYHVPKTAAAEAGEMPEGIAMTPASEHRGYTSLDYPGQYPSRVRRRLQDERPAYYARLRDHIAQNGVELPVLVTRNQYGATHIHNGTHRWAIANELGLPVPVGDYDNPAHRAYQENHPLTKEWESQRTNTYGRTEPKTAAHVPEDEPVVRTHMDLGWSPDEWADARRDPWHASAQLAQAEVRHSHPKLGMPLPRGEEGDAMVGHLLRYAGYQGPTEGAFAARHPDPSKMTSNPSWLNGKPGVALHPDRWDYGTAAHEAAHHVVLYNHAIARNEPQTDEQVHGPEWAHAYGQALNKISRHAGDDFVHHHGRFRSMIDEGLQHVRPGDLDDAEKRLPPRRWVDDEVYPAPTRLASALEPRAGAATRVGVTGYDGLTKRSGMIYLDLPEGAVRRLPGGVDDHHITVVYLGKNVTDEAFEEACRRARLAAGKTGPLHGFLNGTETFEPSDSSREKVPVFVPAYIPGIGALRRELEDLSGSEHRQYRPHVTLAYLEPEDDLPAPHPKVDVSFGRLHVKRGDQVVSFPLGHSQWG
jgi:hypothetical protein